MFNILENLNDEISTENSNIFKSAKFSDFIKKNKFDFVEKLFNFKNQIYCMFTIY